MIGELLSEVGGRVGHGLVLAWFESYVLRLVFLDSSLQSPGQEKHLGILFISFRDVVREYSCLYTLGGRDNGRPSTVFSSVHNLMFIAWHFKRASILRKREREKHLGTFSVHVRLVVLELASLEKKKEERKKMTIFDFFKIRFLGFYKAERKSEDILYSGGSGLSIDIHFVDIELSYDVLSPLPIVLSKHFNHPHPYIEIATAISDNFPSPDYMICR